MGRMPRGWVRSYMKLGRPVPSVAGVMRVARVTACCAASSPLTVWTDRPVRRPGLRPSLTIVVASTGSAMVGAPVDVFGARVFTRSQGTPLRAQLFLQGFWKVVASLPTGGR